MVDNIGKVNIFFFVGGFLAVDELDGLVKFIVNILFNEKVCAVIDSFIVCGGLIIGICNGFQVLVKLGFFLYGNFEDVSSISLIFFYNDVNQYVVKMVEIWIVNINLLWLVGVEVGDIYVIFVLYGEGKFVVMVEEFVEFCDNG